MMKIRFLWYLRNDNIIIPKVISSFEDNYINYLENVGKYFFDEILFVEKKYEDCLSYLFLDFISSDYEWKKNILKEAINSIDKIKNDEMEKYFFSLGESWGVEIIKKGVLIYFSTQEEWFDIIPLECFYKVLINWIDFLNSTPSLEKDLLIEC